MSTISDRTDLEMAKNQTARLTSTVLPPNRKDSSQTRAISLYLNMSLGLLLSPLLASPSREDRVDRSKYAVVHMRKYFYSLVLKRIKDHQCFSTTTCDSRNVQVLAETTNKATRKHKQSNAPHWWLPETNHFSHANLTATSRHISIECVLDE